MLLQNKKVAVIGAGPMLPQASRLKPQASGIFELIPFADW
jgi:hypothetical protein